MHFVVDVNLCGHVLPFILLSTLREMMPLAHLS